MDRSRHLAMFGDMSLAVTLMECYGVEWVEARSRLNMLPIQASPPKQMPAARNL